MKIAYVGQKLDGETAFIEKTGITWMPHDILEVADDVAQEMLKYPGVFVLSENVPVKEEPQHTDTVDITEQKIIPAVTPEYLDTLDKDGLHALAKELGVKVHFKSGAEKIKAALLETLAVAA